jgi:hypothetical protein
VLLPIRKQSFTKAVRRVEKSFPNVQLMFLHTRIYAGYTNTAENPEPYAYEYGFAIKALIQAQIDQLAGGGVDKVAGNLKYSKAPVLLWGPYFWASGTTPRSPDGLVWLRSDFQADGTHPSQSGWTKVGDMMMAFFSTSPYSMPWFL